MVDRDAGRRGDTELIGTKFWRGLAPSLLRRSRESLLLLAPLCAAAWGGGASNPPPAPLTISLQSSTVIAPQDGTQASLGVTVGGVTAGSALQVSATELPAGVAAQFVADPGKTSGTVTFTGSPTAPAGTYSANIRASAGTQTAAQAFLLVVAAVAAVAPTVDTTLG